MHIRIVTHLAELLEMHFDASIGCTVTRAFRTWLHDRTVLLSYPNYHIESLTHFFIDNHPSIYAFIRAAFLNYIFLLSCMLTYDTTEK